MESVSSSAVEVSRHEDTSNGDDITRTTAASDLVLGSDLHGTGDVTNGHLVTLLLDLNFLVRDELTRFNL